MDTVSQGFGFGDTAKMKRSGKGGFKSKINPLIHKFIDSLQHQSTCFDGHAFGTKWRKAFGNFVGIHKLVTMQKLRQDRERSRRFAGAVASTDNVHGGH
jgi:hypothetical protein